MFSPRKKNTQHPHQRSPLSLGRTLCSVFAFGRPFLDIPGGQPILAIIGVTARMPKVRASLYKLPTSSEGRSMSCYKPVVNKRFSVVTNARANRDKLNTSYFGMRSMTWTHWILRISIMLQHAMVLCVDALWILYYNVYIVDKFHSLIIIGASQIVVVCIFFMAGNLMIPRILTANYCRIKDNKYLVILCCSILLIVMFAIAYPLTDDLNMYWLYSVITGFVSGILSMTMKIIILELQPKEYTV